MNVKTHINSILILLFGLITLFSNSCKGGKQGGDSIKKAAATFDSIQFYYDLHNPDKHYKLPSALYEISGIDFYKDDKIACIQDEDGTIFIYDTKKEEITRKIKFGSDGDYEDIVVIDGVFYILKSNGNIYRVKLKDDGEVKTKKYETILTKNNDCEGLCYDPQTQSLLVAAKGSASIELNAKLKDYKAVYRFDLASKTIDSVPVILIDAKKIFESMELDAYQRLSYKLADLIDPDGNIVFQPSGIAIHPITNEYYITASVGKKLIVANRENEITYMAYLDKKLFRQPEGIFFGKNGDLYICNEGSGGKGSILVFRARGLK